MKKFKICPTCPDSDDVVATEFNSDNASGGVKRGGRKMIYRLRASMTDRSNFDSMAFQCGWDASKDGCYRHDSYSAEEVAEIALIHFEAAENADQIGEISEIEGEAADMSDYDEYPATVDDMEEARARWISAWCRGFEAQREGGSQND